MTEKLVLHAIVFKKPIYKSKEKSLAMAKDLYPDENIKGFVRETPTSFRVRVYPKTLFDKTEYKSVRLNRDITAIYGKLIS